MKAISQLLISEYGFFHEKPMKPINIQEISYDQNDKEKMTVKDQI